VEDGVKLVTFDLGSKIALVYRDKADIRRAIHLKCFDPLFGALCDLRWRIKCMRRGGSG
jgi:hypothetical protein